MLSYLIAFVAVAVFPTALAALGGHLATLAVLDPKAKRKWIYLVWTLAGLGVLFAGAQQRLSYLSDAEHDKKIVELQDASKGLQSTVNTSAQRQEYMRGQLESIGVMMGKFGEKSCDPAVGQLAGAISKMADGAARPIAPSKNMNMTLLYENSALNGSALRSHSTDAKTVTLSSFQIKLTGTSSTNVSVRLYLSAPLNSTSRWQETTSDEPRFPTALWDGAVLPVSPQETWNTAPLTGAFKGDIKYPINAKLKVFYGADKPSEATFTINKATD